MLLFQYFNFVLRVSCHGELCFPACVTKVDDDQLVVARCKLLLVNDTIARTYGHWLLVHDLAIHISEEHVELFLVTALAVWRQHPGGICVERQEDLHGTNKVEREDPLAAAVGHGR